MTDTENSFAMATGEQKAGMTKRRTQPRSRPGKSLPTDRMKFDAQLRCLQVYGRLSGPNQNPVTAERVSAALNKEISHYTVGLSNGFFVDAGWLEKRGRGEYAASGALVAYMRRNGVDRDHSTRVVEPLRETMREAWFWQVIRSQVEFGGEENELLHVLMSEAGASAEHLPQLRNLLEWVEWVGLIQRAGGVVNVGGGAPSDGGEDSDRENEPERLAPNLDRLVDAQQLQPVSSSSPVRVTTQAPALLTFDFSLKVTADDLAKLDPQQIQALFAAVGTLMSVKAQVPTD